MKKSIISLSVLFTLGPSSALAVDGLNILMKNNDMDFTGQKIDKVSRQLKLDDAFLIQSYTEFRSQNNFSSQERDALDALFFNEKNAQANLLALNSKHKLVNDIKLYLYFKNNHAHYFVSQFIERSQSKTFLNSSVGMALDQVIAKDSSEWLINNGIVLTADMKKKVWAISQNKSQFYLKLKALAALRDAEKSLDVLKELGAQDKMSPFLAQSVILDFARKNKLAHAAKLIKDVIEPYITKSDDVEVVSQYYMTLARLLYQAKAYSASLQYYNAVPDESHMFLQAKVEALWIKMRKQSLGQIKGEVASLKLPSFRKNFIPELYLTSSMANLQLCQFSNVQSDFSNFIETNTKYINEVEDQLKKDSPKNIRNNFYISRLENGLKSLKKSSFEKDFHSQLISDYKTMLDRENHLQWMNRKKLLESTIRKMRFVKVEYLSTMRRLKNKLALMKNEDSITVQNAALGNSNQLTFPNSGPVFSDEVFHLSSTAYNYCLKGKK